VRSLSRATEIIRAVPLAALICSALVVPQPAAARPPQARGPLEVVRQSNEEVAALLDSAAPLGDEQKAAILSVIESATSFARIAQNSLGPHWEEFSVPQRADFIDTFSRLLSVSSIEKLGRYRADRFEYLGEQIDEGRAVVSTMAFYEEREISLDYVLESVDGEWKITNYMIDGVDTARNYRKQFNKILEAESADQLIGRLRDKLAEYESDP